MWAVVVLYGLADNPRRHGELARMTGGISSEVLTHTLRGLEGSGLVARHAYAEAPPLAASVRVAGGTPHRP
jgi:DNA-binding HxlR family transcriptional regulator